MDLLWVLSVSMLTACVAIPMDAAAGSHSLFTCEPITLRMCQGLPYNATFMPNILNHYDQQTAALAMEVEYPLLHPPPPPVPSARGRLSRVATFSSRSFRSGSFVGQNLSSIL